MKRSFVIVFYFLILGFLPSALVGQNTWTLTVEGTILKHENKKKLEGATVALLKSGVVTQTVMSGKNGQFTLLLQPEGDYIIRCSLGGHVTKSVAVNTRGVPQDHIKVNNTQFFSEFEVSLFEEVPHVDFSILKQPAAKIYYDYNTLNFEFDMDYISSMKSRVDKLIQDYEAKKRQELELEHKYSTAIAKADKAFSSKDYPGAKLAYESASALKPDQTHPKERLVEIEKILADEGKKKELEKKYLALIASADKAFTEKSYAAAKSGYKEALVIKAQEPHPTSRLAEIETILANQAKEKELEAKYTAMIEKADKAFGIKDYQTARVAYSEALTIKSNQPHPTARLKEIDVLLAAQLKYTTIIAAADKAFNEKNYTLAKTSYSEALTLKANEPHPTNRLKEIDALLANQEKEKALEARYLALIATADKAFNAKDYQTARIDYSEALTIKSNQPHPTGRLKEIDIILAKQSKEKELEAKYAGLISSADKAFTEKNYATAKGAYQEALTLKANEAHPTTRLKEIETILAEQAKQKELEEKYAGLIAVADKSFAAKDYTTARTSYQQALALKANEAHPTARLKEIESTLAEQAKQKELEEKYAGLIAAADKSFASKDYTTARTSYQQALALKANEAHPTARLKEIESILGDQAKQKEFEEKYAGLIAAADKSFASKDYTTARTSYQQALALKANEAHPTERLKEIESILGDQAKQKELEEKYAGLIAAADKSFAAKDYPTARISYQQALALKANEAHPTERLKEIESILGDQAKQKELEEKYAGLITSADKSFAAKDYTTARTSYQQALALKANEAHPTARLKEIESILGDQAKQKELDTKYLGLIATADRAFSAKNYTEAKSSYQEALTIKANEAHPSSRLKEIEAIMGDNTRQQEQEARYLDLIAGADKSFQAKDYTAARNGYREALTIKDAPYPKEKIRDIETMLAELAREKELNERYSNLIATADRAFTQKDYESARTSYQSALAMRPMEKHPATRLSEIDRILNSLEAKAEAEKRAREAERARHQQYIAKIGEADKYFDAKEYASSKTAYLQAGNIKPEELYPKTRVAEIDKIMADLIASRKSAAANAPKPTMDIKTTPVVNELAQKYPQGVTEELSQEPGKKIVRRIVVKGTQADEYKKIIYSWGTYYFKNGSAPISEATWNQETQ